jgi:hypothetical protein
MIVVAILACSIGAAAAFTVRPNTAANVLTGWVALYGVPALLILARRVPSGRAVKIAGGIILLGLPVAGMYGLLSFGVSGYVGLIAAFALAALIIGWGALLTAALTADEAVDSKDPNADRIPPN